MQYAVVVICLALMFRGLWDAAMWLNAHLPAWGKMAVCAGAMAVIVWGMMV